MPVRCLTSSSAAKQTGFAGVSRSIRGIFTGTAFAHDTGMLLQKIRLGAPILVVLLGMVCPRPVAADTRTIRRGENLQSALNSAQPGDTLFLEAGAEFVGNFVLPVKAGDAPIVVRSALNAQLPVAGQRIQPGHARLLARLRSPNTVAALRTAAGAHNWYVQYLEFGATQNGYGDIIQLGDGSKAQNTVARVRANVLSHLYVHGDRLLGQKRCVALNAMAVTIRDSYISDCKGVGNDTQAIGGWNGPGPYLIDNNYLEGAGENVLFGGADPAITNLVAEDIVFRNNLVSRPMAWREPIIGTPLDPTATAQGGGSLDAGSYAYRIVARRPVGQGTIGRSTASVQATVAVSMSGSAVRLAWQPVADATEYRVYGRAPGSQAMFWTVTGTEFVDTGSDGTAGAVPTSAGTVWSVKNLFELKNARRVVIEDNVFENHWMESQAGYAIVLTPRNSNGACTWCVVSQVRFERNLVRDVAAGINLLGYDGGSPSQQSVDIAFRHNLFIGLSRSLGGNAWFMLIGDSPRGVVVEHNTIDSDGSTVVNVYGGTSAAPRQITGFEMTANAARHGTYGINGSFFSYGNGIISRFFPDAIFAANYLAGGATSRYPAGTLVAGTFADQFVNAAGGDYTVREGSPLKGGAPDGTDIGAHFQSYPVGPSSVGGGIKAGPVPTVPSNFRFLAR